SLSLYINGNGQRQFRFDKLLSNKSSTLQQHSLSVEYSSNPGWYAVQALPYLSEYPYECAEQTWNRYYSNALASMILGRSPQMKAIVEKWRADRLALTSNLQKNQDIKPTVLEETPWVMDAMSESNKKKNILVLFDQPRINSELISIHKKLIEMQTLEGGFAWFTGGSTDRYITQYIVSGIGHLQQLDAVSKENEMQFYLNQLLAKALPYLDSAIMRDYREAKQNKTTWATYRPGPLQIQYLYLRSFFFARSMGKDLQNTYAQLLQRAQNTWARQSAYMQAMIALVSHRYDKQYNRTTTSIANKILRSLKETSIYTDEPGRYWKSNRSLSWTDAPIEQQALMIEAFDEVVNDTVMIDQMRTWLLRNKQTNNWSTTKATAEACYALLLTGSAITTLNSEPVVQITMGNTMINSANVKQEAGTGYFNQKIEAKNITPSMANITVNVQQGQSSNNQHPSWGAVYWQYFEDADKITTASTSLQLVKKIFIEKNSSNGIIPDPIDENYLLKPGDRIRVRIELRTDRDMEYVHMKDMRAATLDPINTLSGYKWQNRLGYYEMTKDAATHFFFDRIPRGTHVFEYPLVVTHPGNFSNGIATIQCMYAPEFNAHSKSGTLRVTDKQRNR
ncbi:MAG TPA: alpha-2-macroglobulin, partial [Chitinophagaceae bacterium]|nr:alpha-2-macroglobulin [Chitinophagaceae bacterium]